MIMGPKGDCSSEILEYMHCGRQLTVLQSSENTGKWAEKKMLLLPLHVSKAGIYMSPLNSRTLIGKTVLSEAE